MAVLTEAGNSKRGDSFGGRAIMKCFNHFKLNIYED